MGRAGKDAVAVFLIGVPTASTFGGEKEGQVAVAKGKVQGGVIGLAGHVHVSISAAMPMILTNHR
ncbi:hypothetical protein GFM02_09090 [Rhizobium leguminosarum bv. viciae]|nr:hypothetical protein [Rhizobium leguminosarum bv. viciae]